MYGKIFESMYDSSLCGDWKALITFQQLIVLADKYGCVYHSINGLSRRTSIPKEILEEGIKALLEPDSESQSPKNDGRRILPVPAEEDGRQPHGWLIVNYKYYRDLSSKYETKEKARIRKQRQREREKQEENVTPCHASSRMSRHTDTDKDKKKKPKNTPARARNKEKKSTTEQPARSFSKKYNEIIPEPILSTIVSTCLKIDKLHVLKPKPNGIERFEPNKWVQKVTNKQANFQAIEVTLKRLVQYWDTTNNPNAYVERIFKIENQNFNEAGGMAEHDELKRMDPGELKEITSDMLKGID